MIAPFWIEKAWGDSVEDATMDDIRVAIKETKSMDDEHGAFWVGNSENDIGLEIHKDLVVFYNYNDNPDDQLKTILATWDEVENLYQMYFDGNFEQLEIEMRNKVK